MSYNYSGNEMFDIIGRSKKIRDEFKPYFTEQEMDVLKRRNSDNVISCLNEINDDLALALVICNGGLVYKENNAIYNLGVTQALLSAKIASAYGVHSWFMDRDEDKQITIYERFANDYFDKMFGEKGYRQLFSGDSEGFMKDFRNYGATDEEILSFDRAINNSVFTGEYNLEDEKMVSKLCSKISEGRKTYNSIPVEENIETKKKTL